MKYTIKMLYKSLKINNFNRNTECRLMQPHSLAKTLTECNLVQL